MERTFIIFKPDCVQRRLVGRVLSRFEDKGFNIVAMKMLRITPELSKQHYAEHVSKPFYPALEKFITGSPVIAAIVRGPGSDSRRARDARRNERPEGRRRHDSRRL